MADAKVVLEELPEELRQEVVDFAEFLLAKARARDAGTPRLDSGKAVRAADPGEGPWASLLNSLDQFSDDYMAERCQPRQEARESV